MRCIICEKISFNIICKICQNNFLKADMHKREIQKDFFVYSFYNYDEIKEMLNSKYDFYGDRVFNVLAKLSFKKFVNNFYFKYKIYVIPIDDHTRHGFSHSALLAKHLKSSNIQVQYNTLKAQNHVKYAGKTLAFRKKSKRNFIYTGNEKLKIILVDDIVTSVNEKNGRI